jgi:hypothetical protein
MAYLVLQMVDLVVVFSGTASLENDDNGDAAKALRLAQMVVGLVAVFHRANWRVYAVYAVCFAIVCRAGKLARGSQAGSSSERLASLERAEPSLFFELVFVASRAEPAREP